MSKTQIGWIVIREPRIVHKADFECAAWWEDIMIEPGKYPIYVHDMKIWKNGEIGCRSAFASIPGRIVMDYFGSMFYGVPVGTYDNTKNSGNPADYLMNWYMFMLAENAMDGSGEIELLPEYEAREYTFVSRVDGVERVTHGIFKVA